ncbi:MAG: hypothetical protein PF482_00300 [Desulfobacteraceae bacterium]|jgi:hypothetical protein|nr:hypothetical protein [Desulfobacteraceae bacterium]
MGSKIWIINILLFVVVSICFIRSYDVWFIQEFQPVQNLSAGQAKNQNVKLHAITKDTRPASFYDPIVGKNLFFPDRTGIDETAAKPVSKTEESDSKISELEIVVHGVMMTGEAKKALINNPFPEKDESMTIWIKEEDRIDDGSGESVIVIKSIQKEKIVVSIGGKEFDHYIFKAKDNSAQENSSKAATSAMGKMKPQKQVNHSNPGAGPTGRPSEPPFEISPDGEYKIYETPFGKIKRRIN